jgi:hypothetical protein
MPNTRKNTTRRRNNTRRRKYSREKYNKKKKYSKKKKHSRRKRMPMNIKRNMRGGEVKLYDFENGEEILVLSDNDKTEVPSGTLVMRNDDVIEEGWLTEGQFNPIQMKEWIMAGLSSSDYRMDSPEYIELYKDGKGKRHLFTGDGEVDASSDIKIYVKLPPKTTEETENPVTQPGAQFPMKTGFMSSGEIRLYYLKQQASAQDIQMGGNGFLGTIILNMHIAEQVTLEELKSFYILYIRDENVNREDSEGLTMLNLAVTAGRLDLINFLVDVPEIELNSVLEVAMNNYNHGIVNYLSNLRNADGTYRINVNSYVQRRPRKATENERVIMWSMLYYEMKQCRPEFTPALLNRTDINVNLPNTYLHLNGDTPLHRAVETVDLEMVEALIQKGSNIDASSAFVTFGRIRSEGGETPRDVATLQYTRAPPSTPKDQKTNMLEIIIMMEVERLQKVPEVLAADVDGVSDDDDDDDDPELAAEFAAMQAQVAADANTRPTP